MTTEELKHKLISDGSELKLPIEEIELEIRPYSKTYYGRYYPTVCEDLQLPKVVLYQYETKECDTEIDYEILISTFIHEMVHHIQYMNPFHQRKKGIMHDENFWKLYNRYIEKYQVMIGEEIETLN